MQVILRLATLVALVSTVGCGDGGIELHETSGVVKYKGQPVPDATVTFVSDTGPPAIGMTDAAGKFTLNTLGSTGAAAGTYGVSIVAMKTPAPSLPMKPRPSKPKNSTKSASH